MDVQELLRSSRVREALALQTTAVRDHPGDTSARYLLFTLLAVSGEWERAELQLDAVVSQDAEASVGAAVLRQLLEGEWERGRIYHGDADPLVQDETDPLLQARLRLVRALEAGDADAAQRALGEAKPSAPISGRLNGDAFTSLRDLDDRLGPTLEVLAGGRCLWIPLASLRRVEMQEPMRLIDLLWAPARIEDVRGVEGRVHLPALYESTWQQADELLWLGRRTDWREVGGVEFCGFGQRTFGVTRVDGREDEIGALEIRVLELDAPGSGGSGA